MSDSGKGISPSDKVPVELIWIERLTDLLDTRFRIPGTKIRFGADPLMGLIPYFGEIVSFAISGMLVLTMMRYGASGKVVAKMLINLAVDALTGIVPVLGDIVDVFYKANRRNYRLLLEHRAHGKHEGSAWPVLIGVTVVILAMLGCMIWGMVAVGNWLAGLLI
jgi:hypothetical protein